MKRLQSALTAAVLVAGGVCVTPAGVAQSADKAQSAGKYRVAGIDDDASVGRFLRSLQSAVAHDDRRAVARMIAYPLVTRIHGKSRRIAGPIEFSRQYPLIFDAKIKIAVAGQREQDLFANWRGVMIGNGAVWFAASAKSAPLKIIAVNH